MSRDSRALTSDAVRRLTIDSEPWLSCDDCFRLLDAYADGVLSDADMPAMRVHLDSCSACAEEASSLVALLAEENGAG